MSGRQGGKQKPLKKPKADEKQLTEDDIKFKQEQMEQQKKMKEMAEKAKDKKGLIGGGIKKSGKKLEKNNKHVEKRFLIIFFLK
ncbi:hypothetical protein Mgra_00005175 [Meloidogyne graminicola]|uniref:Translation machinery-associated protein 7 homolog n=1 Tax=Meloidogyne graminicola TaxID=189291 RepID=A0A8S9ZQ72_9BILA|nr:hypothetical protein Mgra_00005175 [Meloidogyne graminicola]